MKKPAWLERLLIEHWNTVQGSSTALIRFPETATWRNTPRLLKLRRYFNAKRAVRAMKRGDAKIGNYPTYLTIDPFSACNLRCPLCPTGNGSNTLKKGKLQLDMFRHIIDEMGTYLYNLDLFNWGEPLLNRDIYEMIAYAHRRHIITSVSTNFHFFDEATAERMINSGLDYLILSIDGATQESYEKYRVGGNLERVLKNVRTLTDTRKRLGKKNPYIIWQYLVFRHNEWEIEQARQMALELGVDEFRPDVAYLAVATRSEGEYWVPTQQQYTRYNLAELEVVWRAQEAAQHESIAREEQERQEREEEERKRLMALRAEEARLVNIQARTERNGENSVEAEQVLALAEKNVMPPPERSGGAKLELFAAPPERKPHQRLPNCIWLYITTTLNADGKLYPCCVTSEGGDLIGDLNVASASTLWNSKEYQSARLFSARNMDTGIETVCHHCPIASPSGGQIL